MSDRTDAIVQALFNKPSLQDCSLQQVDYLAYQYPYFSTAQLLLLQKEELKGEAGEAQLQRSALHFCNPLQVTYWLHPSLFDSEMPEIKLFQKPIPKSQPPEEYQKSESDDGIESEELPEATILKPAPEQTATITQDQPTALQPEAKTTEAPENIIEPQEPVITFEPYHTVDYFASQGIKLSQQEASNDKLGKQLKSFTEWLKTMKRLPEPSHSQSEDNAGEQNVAHLAAHSLDTSDVVTESMAEVWLKQGAIEKAVEVYNKLSLQNPSKSAYFAAKIRAIKQ